MPLDECDELVYEVFTNQVPSPQALAVSPGGKYGNFMYVVSSGDKIYRVASNGTAEEFAQTLSVNGVYTSLVFDNTPTKKFGGYLYGILDFIGGDCFYGGIDRILPDGTVETFLNGCIGNPYVLVGAAGSDIDDQGNFNSLFFLADFEVDEFNRSGSTIQQINPDGVRSPFASNLLRGITAIEIDRYGNFNGDLIANNVSAEPWWQGDNAIYRIQPNGQNAILIPENEHGIPGDLIIDGLGSFQGHLFVFYPQSDILVEYNASGKK